MVKKFLLLSGFIMLLQMAIAQQKHTTHVQQIWFAYFNQTRFSDKWGLWADVHLRTKEDFIEDLSSGIARVGLTYYLHDNVKLTGGYAYVNHFPADNHANISRPEHRPWQQIQWHNNYPKARLMQYIRLEERFRRKVLNNDELADGHNFNYRARYNVFLAVPLHKNAFARGTFSWILTDEVHVSFGKEVVYNYFDQNRFFTGPAYHINPRDHFQFGYMNIFQQLAAGNRYRSIHAIRLFFVHNIDARAK